ncbi:unnamed protein product [Ranitomeya imitator]|uniref:5'-nucleotidase n=1 Tax=Ranitomeya imitator TaxID=111125 RepID=A0ABN9L2C8_9NEOB|nr:unnamed protein product [Ranitomeya imitator]
MLAEPLGPVRRYRCGPSWPGDAAGPVRRVCSQRRSCDRKGRVRMTRPRMREHYILHGEETFAVLNRLVKHNKKLFLITNSPFSFVNKGMKHMVGKNWRDLFDVIIVRADKPAFFTDRRKYRHTRRYR